MRGERKPFIPTFRGNKNRESIFGHALIFVCVCMAIFHATRFF